jgi:2-octaprenyl-6-methoxyphenol hydroxylase
MNPHRDIVIAGGGMVGVSLALQLGALLPARTSISLVEGFPFPRPAAGAPDYHPSFDARSTALSFSSRLIYEKMGVWGDLQQWLCPIESIHVSSRGRFGSTVMRASDYAWPALGYVVENAWLGGALIQALYRQGRVELRSPARVVGATPGAGRIALRLAGGDGAAELDAGLLLVADGAGSGLRERLGVAVQEKPYGQYALIANVATAEPHRGCAFERFTDRGPVALLPLLPAPGGRYRSALVWTLAPEEAAHLQGCPEAEFLRALQERFGYRLGRLLQVGERHSYPLALLQCDEQVRQGVVVMGNAAHALHPVAGQGFNLALRDVAELGAALASGMTAGLPPGDLAALQRYQRRQQPDQARTIQFSDRLPSLFMHGDPLLGLARDLALSGLDILPPLKREFVRYAAGLAFMGAAADG